MFDLRRPVSFKLSFFRNINYATYLFHQVVSRRVDPRPVLILPNRFRSVPEVVRTIAALEICKGWPNDLVWSIPTVWYRIVRQPMLVYLYRQPKSQKKYKNHVNTFTWILSKSTKYDGANIIKNRKDN